MFYELSGLHFGKLQVVFVVVAIVIAFAASTHADLSDPTLSVYYNFDGNGDTVKDGSIHGNDGTIEGKAKREDGVFEKAVVLEPNTWVNLNGPEFENAPVEGITIAVWVNHNDSPEPQSIFDAIGTDHGSGLYHVEIRPAGFRWFHRDGCRSTDIQHQPRSGY